MPEQYSPVISDLEPARRSARNAPKRNMCCPSEPVQPQPWSLYLFPILTIPVHVHFLFPIIFIWDAANAARYTGETGWAILFACTMDFILFFHVLIHELGHCLGAHIVGGTISHILLWPLGGLAYIGHQGGSKRELLVAFAGPLTHIPQAIIWFLVAYFACDRSSISTLFLTYTPIQDNFGCDIIAGALQQHVFLFLFNVFVPAYPLDGGRIFFSLLVMCGVPLLTSAYIIISVSTVLGIAMIAFGLWQAVMLMPFVGGWVLIQTAILFNAVTSDQIRSHPLFVHAEDRSIQQPNRRSMGDRW